MAPVPPTTASGTHGTECAMAFRFTVHKSEKTGAFWFRIVAANGNILASSQQYAQKRSALEAIESIKKNAPDAEVVDEG